MRDFLSDVQVKRALSPVASAADNTAWVSEIIDRQGYDSAGFIILLGALPDADATFAVQVDEGNAANLSDASAVADADLIGQDPTSATAPETQAAFTFAADNTVKKIGYRGTKRYIRLTITPSANASASLYAACAVLANSEQKPVIQGTA